MSIRNKKNNAALNQLLFGSSKSPGVKYNDKELKRLAAEKCQELINNVKRNIKIANTTVSPYAYFSAYGEIISDTEKLIQFESYVTFSGDSPSQSLHNIKSGEQDSITHLLNRSLTFFCSGLYTAKDIESKSAQNAYLDFSKDFQLFTNRFNLYNQHYLEIECKEKIYEECQKAKEYQITKRAEEKQKKEKEEKEEIKREDNLKREVFDIINYYDPIIEQHKILKRFGIEVDWSKDGSFTNRFKTTDTYVFPQAHDDEQIKLINNIIRYSSRKTTCLILIDETMCFNDYKDLSILLFPVISESTKALDILNWLYSEMQKRYFIFSEYRCKDIESYNQLIEQNLEYIKEHPADVNNSGEYTQSVMYINGLPVSKEKMTNIICIIQEFYTLKSFSELDNILIPMLLNSKKAGIHLFLFSKFSLRNLALGVKADLLKVGTKEDIDLIFEKSFADTHNKTIDDVDNNMNGYEFEHFCGDVLRKNGFTKISVTQSSGDYGADVTAYKDGVKFAIQCKKYSNPVGVSAIQEVIASKSIYNCHVAVVLTNNYFTTSATTLADKNGVLLWDRNKLIEMMNK